MFCVSTPVFAFTLRNSWGDSYGNLSSILANVIFHYSQVKFITLQEQHTNSTQSLKSYSNITCDQSTMSVKFGLSCNVDSVLPKGRSISVSLIFSYYLSIMVTSLLQAEIMGYLNPEVIFTKHKTYEGNFKIFNLCISY